MHLISHLRGKTHLEAVRKMHDGREPNRDDLQKFNIAQIKDVQQQQQQSNGAATSHDDNKVAKEKQKALKRRSRKIKQRLSSRSQEYEESVKSESSSAVDSTNKSKFRKSLKELEKLCQNQSKTIWSVANVASLDRYLGDIIRGFSKFVCLTYFKCPF